MSIILELKKNKNKLKTLTEEFFIDIGKEGTLAPRVF